MKLLFLDIDGVLNKHIYDDKAQSSTIDADKVEQLNRIIEKTDCKLVISSAWRYLILLESMTLRGFEYLLRTHGIHCVDRVAGFTREDNYVDEPREHQIDDWRKYSQDLNYCILDDLPLNHAHFVRVDGLTATDADKVIGILNGNSTG